MKGLVAGDGRFMLTEDLEVPDMKPGHALVKVVYASVNPTDLDIMKGKYDLWLKLLGYRHPVKSGLEFSGVVETGSERFKKGDRVFGYVDFMNGPKSHQEYLAVNEDYMARMPSNLSFEQAAAIPLGADQVIDYRQTNIQTLAEEFDLIFDLTTDLRFKHIKHLLSKNGRFIPADPMKNAVDFLNNAVCSKKTKYLFVQYGNYEKLTRIAGWVEEGRLIAQIDSQFSFSDFDTAFDRISEKGRRGRVVLSIAE